MIAILENSNPRSFVRKGTVLFASSISLAYMLSPHWVTFSHFASHWYTLVLFVIAMCVALLELWYISNKLRQYPSLSLGANALGASAVCIALILCIPYIGTSTQKSIHNLVTLLFVLFAAFGFASIAKVLRSHILATSGSV